MPWGVKYDIIERYVTYTTIPFHSSQVSMNPILHFHTYVIFGYTDIIEEMVTRARPTWVHCNT